MNAERMIERVSDATGNEWDAGTAQNDTLAGRVRALLAALAGTGRGAKARIVAWFVEDAMNLDADDALMERVEQIVAEELP